jgi:hypothetical protein
MSSPELNATIETIATIASHEHSRTVDRRIRIAAVKFGGQWFCRFYDSSGNSLHEFDSSVAPFPSQRKASLAGVQAVLTDMRRRVEAIVEATPDD